MKKLIKKIIKKLIGNIYFFIELIYESSFFSDYLIIKPLGDLNTYINLSKIAEKNTYSFEKVSEFEKKMGYSIDKKWIKELALYTQVVIKKSPLNYAHGRVLYSALSNYLNKNLKQIKSVNIIETGTARGFSALCMAKALNDMQQEGKISTIDILPHDKKIFWNTVTDHYLGKITRAHLLENWNDLIERYIIFIKGRTKKMLRKFTLQRVHFAFLDANHTFEDIMFEFNNISKFQKSGDIIVFDDYNAIDYPGVFKAVNLIESNLGYILLKITNANTSRGYVIASKK